MEEQLIDAVAEHEKGSQTVAEIAEQVTAVEKPVEAVENELVSALVVEKPVEAEPIENAELPEPVDGVELPALVSAVVHSDPPVRKSQIAEVISCCSVPGHWAVQLRYLSDAHEACVRIVYVKSNPGIGQYPLWKSKLHYIEARFEDYSGIVLVPCPEVVSV